LPLLYFVAENFSQGSNDGKISDAAKQKRNYNRFWKQRRNT